MAENRPRENQQI